MKFPVQTAQHSAPSPPKYILKEATTRSELDAIFPVIWLANHAPFQPLIHGLFPIFGPTAADRENAMQSAKERLWKAHTEDPASHWLYVVEGESGVVVGVTQWMVYLENPYPNGADEARKRMVADWWPEGEGREFVEEMVRQLYAPRAAWIQRPHAVANLMSVHPDHRRCGIGSILVQWGVETADELGIECWVESSPPARRLFEGFGFKAYFKMVLSAEKENASEEWIRYSHEMGQTEFWTMWRPASGNYEEGGTRPPWALGPWLV